tara:strand:+ start:3781 stop:4176 length:396 start_codon:yes stop_codon:yes gene_type:complete
MVKLYPPQAGSCTGTTEISLAAVGRGLTKNFDFEMYDACELIIIPQVGDLARCTFTGAGTSTAWLTVTEGTPTSNGSTITHLGAGRYRLRLDGADSNLAQTGVYSIHFDFYDLADGADWKRAGSRVLSITP